MNLMMLESRCVMIFLFFVFMVVFLLGGYWLLCLFGIMC